MNRPVSDWENEGVDGAALCVPSVLEADREKVDRLRKQQAEYLAMLPVELNEVISAARRAMHPEGHSYPDAFEEVMHLSRALRPMVEHLQTDDHGPDRDALLWIADRIMFGLEGTSRKLDHISQILGNPARLKREAQSA